MGHRQCAFLCFIPDEAPHMIEMVNSSFVMLAVRGMCRQYVEKLLPAVVRLQAWSRKRVARARFLRWRRAQVFLARYARGRAVRVDLRPAGPLPANTCLDWF